MAGEKTSDLVVKNGLQRALKHTPSKYLIPPIPAWMGLVIKLEVPQRNTIWVAYRNPYLSIHSPKCLIIYCDFFTHAYMWLFLPLTYFTSNWVFFLWSKKQTSMDSCWDQVNFKPFFLSTILRRYCSIKQSFDPHVQCASVQSKM